MFNVYDNFIEVDYLLECVFKFLGEFELLCVLGECYIY